MDRLSALLALRLKLQLRAALGSRPRLLALLLVLPGLAAFSLLGALLAYSLARAAEASQPQLTLPVLSAAVAMAGLGWALSPIVAGIAATETHDLGRLLHYPVPVATLVASSLVANLLQPLVLAQLPVVAALALGLAGAGVRWPIAAGGLLLSFALALSAGQAVSLALHAVSRRRRWHDRAQLAGIGLVMAFTFLPMLLLTAGAPAARHLVHALLEADAFVLVPFSWGARAAVHAARGEAAAFFGWAAAAVIAVALSVGLSTRLAQRLYRGELDLGEAAHGTRPATMPLPGALGALVEKDLRVTWRDPRLKALIFSGLIAPLLILLALYQGIGGPVPPGVVLAFASVSGLGVLDGNVFALERQGLGLLLGSPLSRLAILAAKNAGAIALRLPALLLVALAALLVAGPALVPAVVSIMLATQLLAAGLDNYVSILAPAPVPAAGRDPSAPGSSTRGLGAAAIALAAMAASLLVSAPFAFLAWLPYLLEARWLWLLTLPLALAGASAAYFMLASGAAGLLARREPELIALAAGEE